MKNVKDDICNRMSTLRNRLAHGNMSVCIQAIELTDLYIVQVMIYIIRLRSIGMADNDISICINDLFGKNYF